jgi:hypothetical protein
LYSLFWVMGEGCWWDMVTIVRSNAGISKVMLGEISELLKKNRGRKKIGAGKGGDVDGVLPLVL